MLRPRLSSSTVEARGGCARRENTPPQGRPIGDSVEAKIALENAQANLIEYSRAVEEEMMPYAVLEREIEKLDAEQQNSVVMFVRFLVSQKTAAAPLAEPRAKALHRVADENAPQWLDEISGIASLPRLPLARISL